MLFVLAAMVAFGSVQGFRGLFHKANGLRDLMVRHLHRSQ